MKLGLILNVIDPSIGGVLIMEQVDASEQIDLGDEVVTAGIELPGGVRSPYPKGLLIGQVIDVRRDANDVVQTAYLQPTANLDKLDVTCKAVTVTATPVEQTFKLVTPAMKPLPVPGAETP